MRQGILLFFALFFFFGSSAGAVWVKQYEDASGSPLSDVFFTSTTEGYAVGGVILKTTDRGRTWSPLSYSGNALINAISIAGSTMMIVTESGSVETSTDGGATWSSRKLSTSALNDIWLAPDATVGTAVGNYTGAANFWGYGVGFWNGAALGAPANLSVIHGTTSTNFWMAGSNGKAYKSNGSTWSSALIPLYTSTPEGLYVIDSSNVCVVGPYDTAAAANALRTTDGGLNWSALNLGGGTINLKDVWFVGPLEGWAAGENGKVYRTTNGGAAAADWSEVTSGTTANLNALYFTDADNGWAVGGSSAVIYKWRVSPEVLTATPTAGVQGATLTVTLEGRYFQDGAAGSFGSGMVVNSLTFNSATRLTANLTIYTNASTEARTVTVTNADGGVGTLTSGFTVTASTTATVPGVAPGHQGSIIPSTPTWNPNTQPEINLQVRINPGVVTEGPLRLTIFTGPGGDVAFQRVIEPPPIRSFADGSSKVNVRVARTDFTEPYFRAGIAFCQVRDDKKIIASNKFVIWPR